MHQVHYDISVTSIELNRNDESHVILAEYLLRDELTKFRENILSIAVNDLFYLSLIKTLPFKHLDGVSKWIMCIDVNPINVPNNGKPPFLYKMEISLTIPQLRELINCPEYRKQKIKQLLPDGKTLPYTLSIGVVYDNN